MATSQFGASAPAGFDPNAPRQGAMAMSNAQAAGIDQTNQQMQNANAGGLGAMTQKEATGKAQFDLQQNTAQQQALSKSATSSNAASAGLGAAAQGAQNSYKVDLPDYRPVDVSGIYKQQADAALGASTAAMQTNAALQAQRAAQTGLGTQQQAGLAQAAGLESQAQTAQQQGTIAMQGAQAQVAQDQVTANNNFQQATEEYKLTEAKKQTRLTQLTDMLKSGQIPESMRSQVLDEMLAIDPTDPIVQLYRDNPDVLANMLKTSDISAQMQNAKNASMSMSQALTGQFADNDKVMQYYNSGEWQKMMWPDANRLETAALANTPTAGDIKAYEEATGKHYDGSIDSLKDVYAYNQFARQVKLVGDEEIFTDMGNELQTMGVQTDPASLAKLKAAIPKLTSIMQGQDITQDGYKVKWSSDTEDGGLAPLFKTWTGAEQGTPEDKNMDHLFWAANNSVGDNGQITFSAFQSQFPGWLAEKPEYAAILSSGEMKQGDIDNLAKQFVAETQQSKVGANLSLLQGTELVDKVRGMQTLKVGDLAGLTSTQLNSLLDNQATKSMLEAVNGGAGVKNFDSITLTTKGVLESMQSQGIKPGTIVVQNGKIYTISKIMSFKESNTFGRDNFGTQLRAIGPDGTEVVLKQTAGSGFNFSNADDVRDIGAQL